MCGLFGWSFVNGALPRRRQLSTLAAALAMANDTRGGDSWGYFAPLSGGRVRRGLGELSLSVRAVSLARHPLLMAHTRYATTGDITPRNAHPFRAGSIVGAHNGMVYNHDSLNAAYRRRCSVDSQHIFRHLAEGERLDEISAYGAIEYVRADEPDTIRLGRFNGGALAVAQLPGGIVWSSSGAHLDAALNLAGFDHEVPVSVAEGVLYAVRAGQLWQTAIPLPFRPKAKEKPPKLTAEQPAPESADNPGLESFEDEYAQIWEEYTEREQAWARWE